MAAECDHTRDAHPVRSSRERKTVGAMIDIFCRDRHKTRRGLCPDCSELHQYAMGRLDRCPFGEQKPTCANCTIHCYKPEMRQRIREVMRYAGPRMLLRHPILAVFHMLDGRKNAPEQGRSKKAE